MADGGSTVFFAGRGAWAGGFAALMGVLAAALTGCATEQPYVFSEQGLTPAPAASAVLPKALEPTLGGTIALAHEARRQWAQSAREETERKRGVSAGLIGLSAIALIKGVTSPNAKDLAGLGAVSAGLFGWGSTMTSSARNAVYREGMASMACAVAAVEPYRYAEWLGSDSHQDINGLLAHARKSLSELGNESAALQRKNVTVKVTTAAGAVPAACAQFSPAACAGFAPNTAMALLCEKNKADCAPRGAKSVEVKPPAQVGEALRQADAEAQELQRAIYEVQDLQGQSAAAADWLMSVGSEIERRVREGVEKTEPDLATVLSVSQALGSKPQPTAQTPPAPAPQPPSSPGDGTGHSAPPAGKADDLNAQLLREANGLLDRVQSARKQRVALQMRSAFLKQALRAARSDACRRVLPLSFDAEPTTPAAAAPATATAPPVTPDPKNPTDGQGRRNLPQTSSN